MYDLVPCKNHLTKKIKNYHNICKKTVAKVFTSNLEQ